MKKHPSPRRARSGLPSPQERPGDFGFVATPAVLAEILFKVWHGHPLKPDSARVMREIMERCRSERVRQ